MIENYNTILNESLLTVLSNYYNFFTSEKGKLDILHKQLKEKENLSDRRNFVWHVTVTWYIFLKNKSKVLLIHNNNLDMWIWVWWHYEFSDKTIIDCVKREILEEVWLTDIKLDNWHIENNNIPLNIKSFDIPENKKKNENPHIHHDFSFIFVKNDNNENDLDMQLEEIKGADWLSIKDAMKHNQLSDWHELFTKINKYILV